MTHDIEASYPPGMVPGHELAGEIVALGREVRGLRVGDRVTSASIFGCGGCAACLAGDPFLCPTFQADPSRCGVSGGFGEYTVAPAHACRVLPAGLSTADGALVEPLACSLHGVHVAGIAAGDRVLVLGAGAVGIGAVFWARRLGAGRIVVASRSQRNAGLAQALGADAFVAGDEDRIARVHAALGGPPDVVLECSGAPGLIGEALMHVRVRGTVAVLSLCAHADRFYPAVGTMKEATLRFAVTFRMAELEQVVDVLDRGAVEVRAMVTGVVGLDALPAAFEALRGPNAHCKLVVNPGA